MNKIRYCLLAGILLIAAASPAPAQEVVVLSGPEETIDWFNAQNFWGEEKHNEQLAVPRALIVAISERWQTTAQKLTVPVKKELFYRFMLPLVVHANTMVLDRRERLQRMQATIVKGDPLADRDKTWLCEIAVLLRIASREDVSAPLDPTALGKIIDQALYKLDVIPAGLALGQAAYESGYGTSRFAAEGNALFGQWTFGGEGLTPAQQRKALGDHRIARFEWPFDSVRGYFINLSAHPAYADFRRIRAEHRARGERLRSLTAADGLKNYSERGQAYVDTLKGIIRKNNLQIADDAVFRDEPMRFVLGVPDPAAAEKMRADIETMRQSGELEAIIARMRLE